MDSLIPIKMTVLIAVLFVCNACSENDQGLFEKVIVWKGGESNVEGHRIPAIAVSDQGTVLAFSEARIDWGDSTPNHIVMKRSEDGGKTWSNNIFIEKSDGNFWEQNQELIDPKDKKDKKEVWTNPATLVDKETGRIFIFYALNEGNILGQNLQRYTRVFYRYSDDDGLTWSERVEITEVLNAKKNGSPNKDKDGNWVTDFNGFPCDYLGRAFHMPGPGHGIQLSNGRLLLQVWSRTALGKLDKGRIPPIERKYGISTIYSDDHGKTWKYGSSFGHGGLNMSESRILELENGEIYINSRYVNNRPGEKSNYRMTAKSYDQGITWTEMQVEDSFALSNPSDAGLIRLTGETEGKIRILYSKNEHPEGRREHLTIRLSYDEGETWPIVKLADEGPVLYSDLAVLPDKTILCLYGTGKGKPMYVARFDLHWLTEGADQIQ